MEIFPETYTASTFTTSWLGVVTDNIGVVLGILAFTVGIGFVLRLLRKSTKGRV